jgi:hypothetical protein
MSLSLIAVFIPILLMGGIVGRLFREFAVTLSVAILISLVDLADHDADDVRAAGRSGGGDVVGLHRRAAAAAGQTNTGFGLRLAEAAVAAQASIRRGDRAAAAEAGAVPGATLFLQSVQDIRVGGGRATRNTSTRCRATISTSSTNGRRSCCGAARTVPVLPTSTPTSSTRASRPIW